MLLIEAYWYDTPGNVRYTQEWYTGTRDLYALVWDDMASLVR